MEVEYREKSNTLIYSGKMSKDEFAKHELLEGSRIAKYYSDLALGVFIKSAECEHDYETVMIVENTYDHYGEHMQYETQHSICTKCDKSEY